MPFTRDRTPAGSPPDLRSWLERTMSGLDDWTTQIETRVNELIRLRFIDGLEIRYAWDDASIDTGVPADAGEIKCNAVLPQDATVFALSRLDSFGRLALTASLDFVATAGFFEFNDISRTHHYEYSYGNTVQRETDVTIDVVFIAQGPGAPPTDGDLVQAQFWPEFLIADTKQI